MSHFPTPEIPAVPQAIYPRIETEARQRYSIDTSLHCGIVNALRSHIVWRSDAPPVSKTGIRLADLELANAFRALVACTDANERLDWIYGRLQLFERLGCPHVQVQSTLVQWWLDIYETDWMARHGA